MGVAAPSVASTSPSAPDVPTYRYETRGGLAAGGALLFGAGYGLSILVNLAVCGGATRWAGCASKENSAIPFVGPFMFLGTPATEPSYHALMVVDGLAQIGGLAMFVTGLTVRRKVRITSVAPAVSRTGASLSVSGAF